MTAMNNLPNDGNKQNEYNEKTLKEIFSKEIREEIASGHIKKPTFEEFKEAVAKDKAARRKKHAAIAACFVAAVLVGFFAFDYLTCDVGADKNPKETIQTEDGVIIEDGGWGSSVGESNEIVITDYNSIVTLKETIPNLITPNYIPKEYKFKHFKIETIETGTITCEYLFSDNVGKSLEIEIRIRNDDRNALDVCNVDEIVKSSKGEVYIQEAKTKIATIEIDGSRIVNIWCELPNKSIIKIVENLAG